jgi:hypothetical protein
MDTTIGKRLIIKFALRNLDIINPYEREMFIAVVRAKNNPYAENLLKLVDIIIQARLLSRILPYRVTIKYCLYLERKNTILSFLNFVFS